MRKTDLEEKESHISVMHSACGKLSRINDAHDQKLSDNTHPRWGFPSDTVSNHIFWSTFHWEQKKVAWDTIPMT